MGATVRAIVMSRFALDGGAMHGIVPKPLWERAHPADEKNRIELVARAMLVDDLASGARTLVEVGLGDRWSSKERGIYAIDDGSSAPAALRVAGVDPQTVTHVVLTHLHWDHAGGAVRVGAGGRLELAFPRAVHVVGKAHVAHAAAASLKDAGSFRGDEIALLLAHPTTRLWEAGELAPGIDARLSNGHTEGLLLPFVRARDDGPPLAFPTDLVPTHSHLRPSWVMAYDNAPLETVREKLALFEELARIGGGLALYHDARFEAAWARTGSAELSLGRLDGTPIDPAVSSTPRA